MSYRIIVLLDCVLGDIRKVEPEARDCWWGPRPETWYPEPISWMEPRTRDPGPSRWDTTPEISYPIHRWDRDSRPGTLKVGPETQNPRPGTLKMDFQKIFLSFLWRLTFMNEFMCFMRLCLFCIIKRIQF